jgi:fused signal recognition particle receptor
MALNWFKKKKRPTALSDSTQPKEQSNGLQPAALDRDEETPGDIDTSEKVSSTDPVQIQADGPLAVDNSVVGNVVPPTPDASNGNDVLLPETKKTGLFSRLKKGLTKTREILTTDIDELFSSKRQIDDEMLEELEELLITSDIGVQTALDLMQTITRRAAKIKGPAALKETLKQEILAHLKKFPPPPTISQAKPHVVMVVGVNGVGKTTTIGKLAAKATRKGDATLIVAADTFRAAAIEQLGIWAQRAGADMVKHKANADPAAVAYDGMEAAVARNMDIVFVDTAGRLHTKVNLMEELKKIKRTISKIIPGGPHEILLVLDATTGQNALSQAKMFHEAIGVTGLALTKLDGTAKGGIVISICQSLNIPLQYIGVGEGIEDLQDFDSEQFANALF